MTDFGRNYFRKFPLLYRIVASKCARHSSAVHYLTKSSNECVRSSTRCHENKMSMSIYLLRDPKHLVKTTFGGVSRVTAMYR